ncbi:hypothetical protein RJT34_13427 [Clitoria ternatea]|uniref:Uncharacterized protein n=1 Tax=Clitoria ternatea TaxID=43366 RepID=A0AAN9JNH5_CLITE
MSLLHSKLSALDYLCIDDFPDFERFPTEGLVAPNLTCLDLCYCPMLKSLPSHMNTLLPKLRSLRIKNCPKIDAFPEGGLPTNLETLVIVECRNLLRSLSLIGVHNGLTLFLIDDASIESDKSFPWEGFLPQLPSLHTLQLIKFKNIETLDYSDLLHLTSLQVLRIQDCPKLKNMVGERLPPSLTKLKIDDSMLLGEQCKKKHPQIWHKICDISAIQVDWRYV